MVRVRHTQLMKMVFLLVTFTVFQATLYIIVKWTSERKGEVNVSTRAPFEPLGPSEVSGSGDGEGSGSEHKRIRGDGVGSLVDDEDYYFDDDFDAEEEMKNLPLELLRNLTAGKKRAKVIINNTMYKWFNNSRHISLLIEPNYYKYDDDGDSYEQDEYDDDDEDDDSGAVEDEHYFDEDRDAQLEREFNRTHPNGTDDYDSIEVKLIDPINNLDKLANNFSFSE